MPWRWFALGVGVAILGCCALATQAALAYRGAYRDALAAQEDLRAAQTLLRDRGLDATTCDVAFAERRLSDAEAGFVRARARFGGPLLAVAGRVPLLGDTIEATTALMDIGAEGARLGGDAAAMARTFQRYRDAQAAPLPERVDEILSDLDPWMVEMRRRLDGIRDERAGISGVRVPSRLIDPIRELDDDIAELEELIDSYEALSAFLPEFLGFAGERTYLVLAQNNAELMPAGGLISVYGLITIRDGRVTEKRFADAVTYGWKWLERTGDYVEPPAALDRYLLRGFSWNLAVANWSPHFPTSAQDAERFFRLGGGPAVDGVIAINVHTIEELLAVTGPVTVESYGVTVTSENAIDVIEEHTRGVLDPNEDRKAFVGLLADELLSRLVHTPPERWGALLDALQELRDRHQLLVYSRDASLQALSAQLELDGSIERSTGDYLMLADASVHSSKLNLALEQAIDLDVRLDDSGSSSHTLRVSYRNTLPEWSAGRDPELVRRLMLDGLYGGYLRVLTPASSRLDGVQLAGREVGAEEISTEQGKDVFGRYFSLAAGEATELTFDYASFATVRSEGDLLVYRLFLQKQPGTGALPFRLRISLPEATFLHSVELDGAPVPSLTIDTDLAQDREIVVRYRRDS